MTTFITYKAVAEAAEQSPAIKQLVELQEAYLHAHSAWVGGNYQHKDMQVLNACKFAVRTHALDMARRASASAEIIRALEQDDTLPWHEIIYTLIEEVPAIGDFVKKFY